MSIRARIFPERLQSAVNEVLTDPVRNSVTFFPSGTATNFVSPSVKSGFFVLEAIFVRRSGLQF
jgi:hypothetical protein